MPQTATTSDPIRAEVERRLNALADALVVRPFEQAGRLGDLARWPCRTIRARLAEPFAVVRSIAELALGGATRSTEGSPEPRSSGAARPAPAVEVVEDPTVDRPPVGELPIAGYESLAASQVVARLDDLTPEELERVRAFEAAHRGRRTVLGKIEQLLASR
jgi:hypothetical protein